MIRTLAIDDEPLALQQLAAYIKRYPTWNWSANARAPSTPTR